MVLGLTRSRTRLGGSIARSFERPRPADDPVRRWHVERGEILFEASCVVVGGFPGYAGCGGRLDGFRLRVTERYLLVGDGDERGFGLPIQEIDGVAFVALTDGEECGLRLFYRDGVSPRLFTVRFHGNRLSLRSGPWAERAHISLLRAGLVDRFAVSPPPDPDFIVPWEQTADFATEKVIWTGRATVPRHVGWTGVPGNVWLTTRSLIWGCESVAGVHRVPLPVVTDVAATTVADRADTSALYVGLGDETTGHFDLAFLFDQHSTADHNLRERGALLVGLRSRGVPVGSPTPPFQPWRLVAHPVRDEGEAGAELEPDDDGPSTPWRERAVRRSSSRRWLGAFDVPAGALSPARTDQPAASSIGPVVERSPAAWADSDAGDWEHTSGGASPRLLDIVLAEWPSLPDERDRHHDDVQLTASWLSPLAPTVDESSDDESARIDDDGAVAEQALLPQSATTAREASAAATDVDAAGLERSMPDAEASPRPSDLTDLSVCCPRVAAYESASVGVLAEILTAIQDRVAGRITPLTASLPTATDQTAALAELTALTEAGMVTPDQSRARSSRILALGDACVRLRTLVELRDGGHVSDADLARRQQTITGQLAAVMEVR